VKHYLELITDEQAAAIKLLKVGDPIDCGGRREVVTKTEPPSLGRKRQTARKRNTSGLGTTLLERRVLRRVHAGAV